MCALLVVAQAQQDKRHAGLKAKDKEMKETVRVLKTLSVVISLLGVQFVVARAEIILELNSDVTEFFPHKVTPACCSFPALFTRLRPSARLLVEPQGTQIVWCHVPRGKTLLAAPPEGGDGCAGGGGGWKGKRGTFPVEMGLSLPQLLLQLLKEVCLGTRPMGMQMDRHEGPIQKSFVIHRSTLTPH